MNIARLVRQELADPINDPGRRLGERPPHLMCQEADDVVDNIIVRTIVLYEEDELSARESSPRRGCDEVRMWRGANAKGAYVRVVRISLATVRRWRWRRRSVWDPRILMGTPVTGLVMARLVAMPFNVKILDLCVLEFAGLDPVLPLRVECFDLGVLEFAGLNTVAVGLCHRACGDGDSQEDGEDWEKHFLFRGYCVVFCVVLFICFLFAFYLL